MPLSGNILISLGLPTTLGTFTAALGPNGLFGVRGGANDPPGALISRGTPTYGAEPKTATWAASIAPQFLMYGYPRAYAGFSNETPAATTAYELATIPVVPVFAAQIRAGVCQTLVGALTPRLQHKTVILRAKDVPSFCTGITSRVNDQGRGVLAFARRLSDWIAPRPLFAATAVAGGMGGSVRRVEPDRCRERGRNDGRALVHAAAEQWQHQCGDFADDRGQSVDGQ